MDKVLSKYGTDSLPISLFTLVSITLELNKAFDTVHKTFSNHIGGGGAMPGVLTGGYIRQALQE